MESQIHGVQDLRFHLSLGKTAAALNQTISERGFAVVDMSDNRKVSDLLHTFLNGCLLVRIHQNCFEWMRTRRFKKT